MRKGKCLLSKEEIIKMYEMGKSTIEIADIADVSDRYIKMVLKNANVIMRKHGNWKRKYLVNEDYFKTWSNNMAYVLGFFYADGFIASRTHTISFSQKKITS